MSMPELRLPPNWVAKRSYRECVVKIGSMSWSEKRRLTFPEDV